MAIAPKTRVKITKENKDFLVKSPAILLMRSFAALFGGLSLFIPNFISQKLASKWAVSSEKHYFKPYSEKPSRGT